MIIIVGGGVAGLTCAKLLTEAGRQVLVLEATDHIGGRMRTDYHEDGYRLDRGFQVLFTAYPAAMRHLDYNALKMRKFAPGALLVKNGKRYQIADPLREPQQMLGSMLNPLISTTDKVRVMGLRLQLARLSVGDIFSGKGQADGHDETTEAYLRRQGFSHKFIDNFMRPFYGGIFLERSLQTSARMFQFTFKMLAEGETILPAEGIQSIPEQLARSLPKETIRYNAKVSALLINEQQVHGVRMTNGEQIAAEQVVIATSSPIAQQFVENALPTQAASVTCLYFAGDERLYTERKLLLNAEPDAYVNNAVLMTNIAPTYGPPRKHLLSVTVLGNPEDDDERIAERCRAELGGWFPEQNMQRWQLLAVYRVPFAQFTQPPDIFDKLPDNRTAVEGLYIAGEFTKSSSIQGAMHSGEHAAKALLQAAVKVPRHL